MCDKSLVSKSCDLDTLCGISSRFQLLFPSHRQVAHALLTRPPLTLQGASRRINQAKSVRLECVRHAASVHPEPGSNSLIYCILHQPFRISTTSVFVRSYCFLEHLLKFKRIFRSLYISSLFNFQGAPVSSTALLLYHFALPMSIPFFNFFEIFSKFFLPYFSITIYGQSCFFRPNI